jgi:hypothetical protein
LAIRPALDFRFGPAQNPCHRYAGDHLVTNNNNKWPDRTAAKVGGAKQAVSIHNRACFLSAAAVALLLPTGPAQVAAGDDARPGDELIDEWAGNYDIDAFFALPGIRTELHDLLGPEFNLLMTNLDVKGDIDLVRGALSVAGNAVHGGPEEEAVVCVMPADLAVHAAILSAGRIRVYTRAAGYEALPLCIKDWITLVSAGYDDRFDPRDNVEVVQR